MTVLFKRQNKKRLIFKCKMNQELAEDCNNSSLCNISSSCASRDIQFHQGLPLSMGPSIALRSIQFLYYLFLIIFGFSLNTFILLLIAKSKKLQTISFAIALQVVIVDLFWGSLAIFPALINIVAGRWILGSYFCMINGFLLSTVLCIRRTLMMVLVIDRFLLIFQTFSYPKHHFKVVLCLSIFSWVGSVIISAIALPEFLDCYSITSQIWLCYINQRCSETCSYFSYAYYGLIGIPFCIFPLFLYIILYIKARKMRKEWNGSTFHKKEWKATVTFFLMFFALFITTLPNIGGIIAIRSATSFENNSPPVTICTGLLSSVVSLLLVADPIVIMRNKDVQDVISEYKTRRALRKISVQSVQ